MDSRPPAPQTVSIYCPTCGTLLHPDVLEQPSQVRCPDCFVSVPVPSLADVLKKLEERRPRKLEDVGTYNLQGGGSDDAGEPPKKIAPYVKIRCRICHSLLHPEVREEAYQIRCPDCHEAVFVPAQKDVPKERRRKRGPPKIGSYTMNAATAPPKPQTSYLEVQAEIRQEAIDRPPRWTFFSGVFFFPWSSGVLKRWGWLSLGFTILALLAVFVTMLIGGESRFGVMGAAFLVLPAIWMAFWTCSYAAACFLPVVSDTAAGMNRVANWPEGWWNDWMADLCYVLFVGGQAVLAGYGLGLIAELLGGPRTIVWAATAFVLYAVFQLSSLEANSALVPLTRPILRSLRTSWWGWGLYYGLTGTLVLAFAALAGACWKWSPTFAAFILGPMFPAVLLIIARLLGRLAWRAALLESVDVDVEEP